MHRVIRRSLVVAAALWPCFASPSQAAPASSPAEQATSARPLKLTHAAKRKVRGARKSSRHRHAERRTRTTAKAAKVEETKKRRETAQEMPAEPSALEPAVANAHAELTSDDAQPRDMASRDMAPVAAETESNKASGGEPATNSTQIAANQLNDGNRNVNVTAATPSPSVSMANYTENPTAFSQGASEGDAWDRASLIGKIFIAFGTLLTLASAARLMIA